MAKITIGDILSGYASTDSLNTIFQAIEDEFNNKVLYRNNPVGEPNQMENNIDMNSNRVVNLPSPINVTEPVRVQDLTDLVAGTPTAGVVSITDAGGLYDATTVEGALEEVVTELNAHIAAPTDAHQSSAIGYTPNGTGAVATTVQAKLREIVSVTDFGVDTTGTTTDTSKVQAAITAASGKVLRFPSGTYKFGPQSVNVSVQLLFEPGATVVPVFDAGSTEKLLNVTAADVVIDGLVISSVTGTISGNKYLIYAGSGGDRLTVRRCEFSSITQSDGNVGLTNLIVTHGIYLDSVNDALVERNRVNAISGAAVFAKAVNGLTVTKNHFTDTKWYSINLDYDVVDFDISRNIIDGSDTNARYWGGSINLMSQTTGGKNKRGTVERNTITGIHNYGAAIRVLSVEDVNIQFNKIYDCTNGAIGPDADIQYIGIDRRGVAEGSPENGPCINVTVSHNLLKAGTGTHLGIYIKNQYKATRDPHENIIIAHNVLRSPSSSANFRSGISVHGQKCGYDLLKVEDNICEVLTITGSTVGGGIGVVSTNSDGLVDGLSIQRNQVVDIATDTPNDSVEVGIYIQATIGNGAIVRGNSVRNFYYGIRTASGLNTIFGLEDNFYDECINDTLYQTAAAGGGFDMSRGTVLPVIGVYRVGHIRQDTDAAASASWGWIVTTAGGAMTGLWAIGQTYTAGVWYRNASGRVYELITAGGGTTANEPAHTTVGQDVTEADGYVWRCRATTSARWATLPALGTVAALP